MHFEKPPVVIDNGSFDIKAGFACDNHPVSMFRTLVGRPNYLGGRYGREHYDVYIGDDATLLQLDLELNYPIVHGKIDHWDNMERIWHHIFYRELKVAPEDRAVILACGVKSSMKEKIQCCEIFFETLNSPVLCIQPQAVLSLYGSGATTGVCVDIGHDSTDIVPIYEGGIIKYAHIETGIAGFQISEYIQKSLQERNIFNENVSIEDIKKQYLYATPNCAMKIDKQLYISETGDVIDVSNEAIMGAEIIFQPKLFNDNNNNCHSLHETVRTSVLKCDAELRTQLCDAIVLCGGSASVPGICERLRIELQGTMDNTVTILSSVEPYAVAWLGGATFAGLPDAEKLWIQKKQFEDYGEKIVKNKFM
ncbi:actin-3-like [Bicyclus anynana]|uniref:Actin-3-like n=1 Tax=Bicyclus anynana TaxID=110368 RepID=A0A6J1MYH3_BICAN|nr:actin-3-like [Bicyclus anynana]